MKYLKTFEYFDSPELKGKFTPDEIKKLAFSDDPYSGDYKSFQYGLYQHGPLADLNDYINDAKEKGYGSTYGISDYLYNELVKNIPDFKTYKRDKYDNKENSLGFHLKKQIPLDETRFSSEVEIWVYYHTKNDNVLDYKKGKIKILFVCGLRPTQKSVSLGNPFGKETDTEKEISKSFSDMVYTEPSSCPNCEDGVDIDDKKFDVFMNKLQNSLYGHPDNEDKFQYEKLKISNTNLSIESYLKSFPKIKKNLDIFKNYIKNKYKLSI